MLDLISNGNLSLNETFIFVLLQFPHQYNGDDGTSNLTELLKRLIVDISVKHMEHGTESLSLSPSVY